MIECRVRRYGIVYDGVVRGVRGVCVVVDV